MNKYNIFNTSTTNHRPSAIMSSSNLIRIGILFLICDVRATLEYKVSTPVISDEQFKPQQAQGNADAAAGPAVPKTATATSPS